MSFVTKNVKVVDVADKMAIANIPVAPGASLLDTIMELVQTPPQNVKQQELLAFASRTNGTTQDLNANIQIVMQAPDEVRSLRNPGLEALQTLTAPKGGRGN